MIILDKDDYRICTITQLTIKDRGFVDQPVSAGLAIERKDFYTDTDDNPVYYVVCFVEYNEHEQCAEIDDVGMRILDVDSNDWNMFKELLKTAKMMVELANKGF